MYTFLECFLPPSSFDGKPEISLKELNELYGENLSKKDLSILEKISIYLNIFNLRAFFTQDRLISGGTLEADEIPYAIEREIEYPEFVFDYLHRYPEPQDRIHHFRELLSATYDWLIEHTTGFLHAYFTYDKNLWITTIAYLGKKRGRKVQDDLAFLDPLDDVASGLLSQHDSEHFEFPEGFEGIDLELDIAFKDPLKELEMLARLRYNFCRQFLETVPFTLDSLLAYYVQIVILTDYYESQDTSLMKKGGDLLLKRIQEIR